MLRLFLLPLGSVRRYGQADGSCGCLLFVIGVFWGRWPTCNRNPDVYIVWTKRYRSFDLRDHYTLYPVNTCTLPCSRSRHWKFRLGNYRIARTLRPQITEKREHSILQFVFLFLLVGFWSQRDRRVIDGCTKSAETLGSRFKANTVVEGLTSRSSYRCAHSLFEKYVLGGTALTCRRVTC